MIWTIFYSYLVWGRAAPFTGKLFCVLTTSKPVLLLGEASYSLYLVHRPVQVVLASLSLGLIVPTQMTMLIVQMIAIVIAVPVSLLLFFFVERPGIQLGRIVAGKAVMPEVETRH